MPFTTPTPKDSTMTRTVTITLDHFQSLTAMEDKFKAAEHEAYSLAAENDQIIAENEALEEKVKSLESAIESKLSIIAILDSRAKSYEDLISSLESRITTFTNLVSIKNDRIDHLLASEKHLTESLKAKSEESNDRGQKIYLLESKISAIRNYLS